MVTPIYIVYGIIKTYPNMFEPRSLLVNSKKEESRSYRAEYPPKEVVLYEQASTSHARLQQCS